MSDLAGVTVMVTAWRRPYYLGPVLESWAAAEGIADVDRILIALGVTDRYDQQMALIDRMRPKFPCDVVVVTQSPAAVAAPSAHRAIAEAGIFCFQGLDAEFVVFGEEDIVVSSDVLQYMAFCRRLFADESRVLAACAHNVGGQGWDEPIPASEALADQHKVRLIPYFNPWVWGTWRDRWELLESTWDYDVTSGGPTTSGYDWNIQLRVMPGRVCVVPDASRSQNTGQFEGGYSQPALFAGTQSRSFRRRREPGYELVTA